MKNDKRYLYFLLHFILGLQLKQSEYHALALALVIIAICNVVSIWLNWIAED